MIRWSYGINQFKPQFDDFTRRREHERALRVISISGFTGVELSAGSGRWEPLGNPTQIAANFGSVAGFREFVEDAALDSVSSWVWDPTAPFQEDLSHGTDPLDPEARPLLVEHARWLAKALEELGGSVLVARPCAGAGRTGPLDDAAIERLASTWQLVGEAIAEYGVRLGLHFDFLSGLRADGGLERFVAASDPDVVGLTLDTAELTIAGIDPVRFLERHADRVVHVQLKNAAVVDDLEEYRQPAAEYGVLRAGGSRAVPRWFLELGASDGLVDSTKFVRALRECDYDGWIVVESDFTPHPATSVMLNGWEMQHVLAPILQGPSTTTSDTRNERALT
ncbi:inosose dehydratase [Agromyces flavus]|uniref:Inosose dehydratase n=1 Tax=Agromyces flavus TaxID=589382 RepID=A0A1H1P5Q6_9MICO|nr:sugar phosphate isomerase/epimerase [Agromyces flavus]MCP2367986.1 inosose dehydratase [Agromyces flavus]GGI47448.1 hypothetical protein GCM10010932_21360 [Agromyces flavus]SDS06370.1 inosose dehydratase [Agromyces flavus]